MTAKIQKFEFTEESKVVGITLRRIRSTVAIGNSVAVGDLGGWLEKESNLDHSGDAWVSGNAVVSGDARVSGDAWVSGDARIDAR